MNRYIYGSSFFSLLMLALCTTMQAQSISVSSTLLTLNEQSWSVEVKVKNLTPHPVQVSSKVAFNVIRSDADGHLYLDSAATWDEMARSCAAWLKISPRELTLPANSWRTLRVSITTPHSLSNGEFWGNLVLQTEGEQKPELSVPIVVHKGNVETGLELGPVTARMRGSQRLKASKDVSRDIEWDADTIWGENSTLVLVEAKRLGNGAYHGTVVASIRRDDGTEVATSRRRYSLLWDRKLRLEFPRLKDGSYILALESRNEHQEGSVKISTPPSPVAKSVRLVVKGNEVRVVE